MLNTEQLKMLKQVNVSKDAETTMARVKSDFSAAPNDVKSRIVALSGQKRSAYYRVFKTGALNARLLLSMAHVLDVTPFYYTGEEEDKKPCGDAEIKRFLLANGYDSLTEEMQSSSAAPAKRPRRKPSPKNQPKPAELPEADTAPEREWDDLEEELDEVLELFDTDEDAEDVIVYEFAFPDDERFNKAMNTMNEDEAVLLLKSLFKRAEAGGDAEEYAELVKRCLLL